MKKNQEGFSLIEILIVAAIVGLLGVAGWLFYSHRQNIKQTTPTESATPAAAKSAADAFLVSKVGNNTFNQYYTFDKSKSSYANPKDSVYDFIAYHFSPFTAISGNDDIIMVQVNRSNLKDISADSVPDCIRDASYCEFKVNSAAALTIAKQNSLTASDASVSWHTSNDKYAKEKGLPFVIVVSSCTQNKSLFIDYRDGTIIGTESSCGSVD